MTASRAGGLLPHVARRIRRKAERPLIRGAEGLGYDLVRRDYYSPIPDLRSLPQSVWSEPSALGGVSVDLERQMTFLERDLAPFVAEFQPPLDRSGDPTQFFLRNGTYESVDAETLYAMVRFLRPKRTIELGSGRSTQVITAARARNALDGAASEHHVIDPFPTRLTQRIAAGAFDLEATSATDVPIERFKELASGDLLFVDTTHTVRVGGDVAYIVLEVLPALAAGVIVHFHDIFLPWSYPRDWFAESRRFWAEQYLLQAFLAFNGAFEPLLATHFLARRYPDRMRQVIPTFGTYVQPGAFWLSRVK
jgi:Methyltransferase domain